MKHELTAKRLQVAMNCMNITAQELSNKSGVAKASISQYINGSHKPSNTSSDKMASILKVNSLWLMGFDVPMHKTSNKHHLTKDVSINVFGRITADTPIEEILDIIDTEKITEELAHTGTFFGLRITGNSMEPRILDGDVVIVRQQPDAQNGDIVIVTTNDNDATCRRLRKYRDGIELISNNPSYEPMYFSNDDINKKSVCIIGKVVELRGKF